MHPIAPRRLRDNLDGAAATEFAMISTAMFLLLLGSIEFGRMLWTVSALNYAVEEGARCASVTPSVCGTSSQVATLASNLSSIPASAFTYTSTTCGNKVVASYTYPWIATGLFSQTLVLSAQACFP